MTFTSDGGLNYVIRLTKGERWSEAFAEFVATTKVNGAWLNIIGSITEVTLGFYDLTKKQYQWQTFEGLREIAGFQGNVSLNETGELMFHMHGTVSDENYQTIGGHVKDFISGATVEVFVHCLDNAKMLQRKTDPTIGLQLLDFTEDS